MWNGARITSFSWSVLMRVSKGKKEAWQRVLPPSPFNLRVIFVLSLTNSYHQERGISTPPLPFFPHWDSRMTQTWEARWRE